MAASPERFHSPVLIVAITAPEIKQIARTAPKIGTPGIPPADVSFAEIKLINADVFRSAPHAAPMTAHPGV